MTAVPEAGLAPPNGIDAPRIDAPAALLAPKSAGQTSAHPSDTSCAACHVTGSWANVRFNHERTGFTLTGRHVRTSCKACHVSGFTPLPRSCGACHRDVHGGDLGTRCESCHDTTNWRSRFDADAHRRTNFPLLGAHAALPCVECHAEARERRFSRAVVDCQACHQTDALRASTTVTPVNHAALGLDQRPCRQCHSPLSFRPALFPSHDQCFPISSGPHAVGCLNCHTSLGGAAARRCGTGTAHCTGCHTNDGTPGVEIAQTDRQHSEGKVAGYAFADRRCVECHYPFGPVTP